MLTKNIFYLIICFISTSCKLSNTFTLPRQDDFPSIYEKVVHVLELCFQDNLNPLITTTDTMEQINSFSSKLQTVSVILIDNYLQLNHSRNFNTKMSTFLLTIYSRQHLRSMLMALNSSPWWKMEAPFIVIGTSNTSCVDVFDVLNELWKKKIISTIYFCYNNNNEVMLYTFNPFTRYAPNPWMIVSSEDQDDPWTLYHQHLDDSETICKNLMFDKTKYINGYQLKIVTSKPTDNSQEATKEPYNLDFLLKRTPFPYKAILPAVFKVLNFNLSIYDGDLGWMSQGIMSGCLVNLSKGEYDIYLQQRPLYFEYPYKTILFLVTDMTLLSTKTPFLKTEEKILEFCQLNIFILICFVGSITTLLLKVIKKQDLTSALLNILRVFLYTSILQPLSNCSVRIYLFGVFWLVVIVNGTFQGKLSTFLTKPDRHLIESIDDVIKFQYHLYLSVRQVDTYKELLSSLNRNHIHLHKTVHCDDAAVNDTHAVCIGEGSTMVKLAEKKHYLHVSSPINQISVVWLTSPDFLFIRTINNQLYRCIESGLMKRWYDQGYPNQRKKMLIIVAEETKAQYRSIRMYDILFAFKLLFIGIFFSTVVFIMEIRNRHVM